MGSAQKMLDIKEEDKDNKETSSVKADIHGRDRNYKILNRNLQRDRKALIKFKLKMEKEIESIKSELSYKEGGSTKLKIEESFEKAILSDLGKYLKCIILTFIRLISQKGWMKSTEVCRYLFTVTTRRCKY